MTNETFLYNDHESVIKELTLAGRPLKDLVFEIQELYLADLRPWIIGFSGGKDSTTILSLIYSALLDLPPNKRHKHVYVVSSDTLVETPVVVDLARQVMQTISNKSDELDYPHFHPLCSA